MATYDYKGILEYIDKNFDDISEVEMGMAEDWFWTAETVYEKGEFLLDLREEPEIGGIKGSYFATPSIKVTFHSEEEVLLDAYVGESGSGVPNIPNLGVLSQPVQYSLARLKSGSIKD